MDNQEAFGVPQTSVQCQRLLAMMGEKVLSNRTCWLHVGQCLYNMLGFKGKELFERYTVPQYREQLENVWDAFSALEPTRHGLGSLKTMAVRYCKDKYDEWIESTAKSAAVCALEETAGMTEIADIVKLMYEHCFICTNVKRQDWWHFNGNNWVKLSGGHAIQQCFSRRLSPIFKGIYEAIGAVDNDADVKYMKKRAADITRGLKEPGFKSVLMTECSQIFLNESFTEKCDEDPMILGIPNGVLVLEKGNIRLRESYPEDWITLQMGVPYDEKMSWDHEDVKYIMNFFKKVLYKEDLINFSIKHKGTCLVGGNLDKLLVMNIGTTAHNAKTTCATLDRYVFGRYSGKLPLSVITVGRVLDQSAATPALAQTKGTRLQQLDEPSRKQEFNGSVAKTLTGNDEMWVRQLYGEGFYINPQFNLVMYGNDAPNNRSEGNDSGMIERVVWVPHDSRFTMEAPEDEAEQWKTRVFTADPHICGFLSNT
jgi:phage/plasmid-associated DNA primase